MVTGSVRARRFGAPGRRDRAQQCARAADVSSVHVAPSLSLRNFRSRRFRLFAELGRLRERTKRDEYESDRSHTSLLGNP